MKDFVEWISFGELMKRWEVDNDMPIFDALKDGLPVFERIEPGEVEHGVATDIIERLQGISGGRPLSFDMLLFKRSDVERYEAENGGNLPDGKTLSYNSILKQPVFQKVMAAMTDVLLHCEKNRPAKRDDAYDIFNKHNISKHVFDVIWKAIPAEMKRKAGQRDR